MTPRWEAQPRVRRGRYVVHDLHAHLVFVTKYRRGALTGPILNRCGEIMEGVCADLGAELVEFNGEHDHVHLHVRYPASLALSRLVNSLKGVSSRRLRQEHGTHLRKYLWGDHLWSPSYFAGSAGGAPLDTLRDYIQNQRRPG